MWSCFESGDREPVDRCRAAIALSAVRAVAESAHGFGRPARRL